MGKMMVDPPSLARHCGDRTALRRCAMRRTGLAALLLASALPGPGAAQTIETAQTLPASRPKAFAAYAAVLPEAFGSVGWIRRLDGTSEPLQIVASGGRDYALGFSCQPHDCGANALAFLAALDGSRAIVMLKSDEQTSGSVQVYGPSTPQDRTLLKDVLSLPR